MKTFVLLLSVLLISPIFAQYSCNTSSKIDISTCETYLLPSGSQTLTASGKYSDVISNFAGCDSLIEINLTINEPIEVTCTHVNEIENNCYRVIFTISGGYPSGDGGTYLLTGDYQGLVQPKQAISSQCMDINESFKVHIEDGNGCVMSFTDGPFLPISLLSFSIEAKENGHLLKWVTATEINNNYFAVLRSTNGVNFNEIARIDGSGTTSSTSTYSYFDELDYFGSTYYKLNQVDYDGTTVLVGVVTGERYEPSFTFNAIYPNPVEDALNIDLQITFGVQQVEAGYDGSIKIYNAAKQLVYDFETVFNYGQNIRSIDVHDFDAGIYTLVISSNEKQIAKQFVKEF